MPLIIVADKGEEPEPQIVDPKIVIQKAREGGNPNAALAIAYTDPIINIDQTGLHYQLRNEPKGQEFSFDTGTLRIKLKQQMFISNTLSNCAKQKWIVHEKGHVRDYQAVMSKMEEEIKNDPTIWSILIKPKWIQRKKFDETEKKIFNSIVNIFKHLTAQASAAHDTRAEYMQVHSDILRNCPEPYIYEVIKGDTLSRIADFMYGLGSAWQSIYRENQAVIGDNPHMIQEGQRLVIPRTP